MMRKPVIIWHLILAAVPEGPETGQLHETGNPGRWAVLLDVNQSESAINIHSV